MTVITEAYAHQTQCERQSPLTHQDQSPSPREASGSASVAVPLINMQTRTVTESETAYYAVSLSLNACTVGYVVCYISTLLQSLTLTDNRIQYERLVTKRRICDRNAVNLLVSVVFHTFAPTAIAGSWSNFLGHASRSCDQSGAGNFP